MKKILRSLIRKAIVATRAETIKRIKFENGDPRESARAVRTSVYTKLLGAQINIYNSRRRHGVVNYNPPRKLRPGQRGGNRKKRSDRTEQLLSYPPLDRGFILRFVNSGTKVRYSGYGRNGRNGIQYDNYISRTGGLGRRGEITPRNFFRAAAEPALVKATGWLADMIDEELEKLLNKTK